MRRRRAVWRSTVLAVVLIGLLSGCGLTRLQDLNFRVDDRLHFTGPEDRALLKQPFTVSWTMDDFRIAAKGSEPPSEDAGYFAVFVDQAPVKPRETLDAVADGDTYCENDPKCPDTAYLHEQYVYPTTRSSIRLRGIPNVVGHDDVQLHSVTVVLMDTAGHRIGESAWELDVRMRRVGI